MSPCRVHLYAPYVCCSEFERSDLTSHLDMTYSQLSGLRDLLTGSPGSPPQINFDANLMLEVRVALLSSFSFCRCSHAVCGCWSQLHKFHTVWSVCKNSRINQDGVSDSGAPKLRCIKWESKGLFSMAYHNRAVLMSECLEFFPAGCC